MTVPGRYQGANVKSELNYDGTIWKLVDGDELNTFISEVAETLKSGESRLVTAPTIGGKAHFLVSPHVSLSILASQTDS